MAWTKGGMFVATAIDMLTDQTEANLDAEDNRLALYGPGITPDFDDVAAAYGVGAWAAANERTGPGWPAGGILVPGTTVTGAAGVITFDAPDPSADLTTLTDIAGALIHAAAVGGDPALCAIWLGGTVYATNGGTFTIQVPPTGIFALRVVPV